MKNLLIISYDFPPASRGIWRTIKFCRYMGEFGWRPYILTVKPVRTERWDWSPLEQIPADTEIRRTESVDPHRLAYIASEWRGKSKAQDGQKAGRSNPRPTHSALRRTMDILRAWVLQPDDRIGWYPFAVQQGKKWLREQEFDAVYSTCFPNTAHLVGERLARYSGLPYIADFRDIWIGNYYFYHPATRWHDHLQRRQERRVVEAANLVISATGPITGDFADRYPDQPAEKFLTITNGFDPIDFEMSAPRPDPDHFTTTYAGTMFGSTSPRNFFRAIARLLDREPRWRDVLRLRFVGTMIEEYQALIGRHGLSQITRIDGYLSHEDALAAMAEADALLLLVAPVKGSHIMLTQKVFEYVAARRPVLGLVPESAARDFLEEIGEGPVVHPDDVDGIEASIRRMLLEWEENGRRELAPNPRLERYHRRNLTERFCRALDVVVP